MVLKRNFRLVFLLAFVFAVFASFASAANFYTSVAHTTPYIAAHAIPDNSTVGYWQFEKPSNATFTNDWTKANNGTVNGATWTEQGRIGGAYNFDGVSNFINLSNPSSLQLSNLTISLWFMQNKAPASYPALVGHGTNGWAFGLSNEAGNTGKVFMSKSGSAPYINSVTVPSNNVWYHLAVTINGTNTTIYVNGVAESSVTTTPAFTFANGLSIGRDNGGGGIINGTIDEVMIFNRSLSTEEIQNIFKAGNATRIKNRNDLGISVVNASNYSRVIYDWRIGNISLALLNMPFEIDRYPIETTSTVLYLPFGNESGAANAIDLSNSGNNMTVLNGAAYSATSGVIEGGYTFDGINDFLNVSDAASQRPANITVMLWINTKAYSAQLVNYPISKGGAVNGWAIGVLGTYAGTCGGVQGKIFIGNGTDAGSVCSSAPIRNNTWYHIAFTNNGTTTVLYVNGANDASGTQNLKDNTAANLTIGVRSDNNWYFNGTIDEVMMFNRTLSAGEIQSIYNRTLSVRDFSSFGNNATLNITISPYYNLSGGKVGGAYVFNGVNNYINTSSTSLGLAIEVWQKNSTNVWTHMVNTSSTFYVNGIANGSVQTIFVTNASGRVLIGTNGTSFFNGTIDEVRIWNRTLSADEVLMHYYTGYNNLMNPETEIAQNFTVAVTLGNDYALNDTFSSDNLYISNACGAISSTTSLDENTYSPGVTCINLTAPNILFDCAGFHLFGNTAGFGIWSNSTNVSIANCLVSNFSSGIVFRQAHNSSIFNSTIRNNNDSQIWLQNTTDALIYSFNSSNSRTTNITGGTIGLFLDNSSQTNIFGIVFNSSQIAVKMIDGIRNLFINGTANKINNVTFLSIGSKDAHIYNFTQTLNPPMQFNLTSGSNLTITNSTIIRSNISTDATSWMWLRWYVNVSTYLNSTNLLDNATINVTDRNNNEVSYGNVGSGGNIQFMLIESIFNRSTVQLNFTPFNFTANSSGYDKNTTSSVNVLESMNVTVSLAMPAPPAPQQTQGGAGHSGSIAAGLVKCNATAGFFLIDGSCRSCLGTVMEFGNGTYTCTTCDTGTHFDNTTNTCVDDKNMIVLKALFPQSLFLKLGEKGKWVLMFAISSLLIFIFFGDRKKKKKEKKKVNMEEED